MKTLTLLVCIWSYLTHIHAQTALVAKATYYTTWPDSGVDYQVRLYANSNDPTHMYVGLNKPGTNFPALQVTNGTVVDALTDNYNIPGIGIVVRGGLIKCSTQCVGRISTSAATKYGPNFGDVTPGNWIRFTWTGQLTGMDSGPIVNNPEIVTSLSRDAIITAKGWKDILSTDTNIMISNNGSDSASYPDSYLTDFNYTSRVSRAPVTLTEGATYHVSNGSNALSSTSFMLSTTSNSITISDDGIILEGKKAFGIPTVTSIKRDGWSTPPNGLLFYNTDHQAFEYHLLGSTVDIVTGAITFGLPGINTPDGSGTIGINTTVPNPYSVVHVLHSIILPKLSSAERDMISPRAGSIIYNTDTACIEGVAGSQWVNWCDGSTTTISTTLPSLAGGTVGINTTTPDPDTALDIYAVDGNQDKGLLVEPVDRSTIIGKEAMLIYDIDNHFYFYNGNSWIQL